MRGLPEHLRIALRLGTRNRMALLYGYLFPLIFLLSFLAVYRLDEPLLIRHMGELLTVGVLGAACFGLPTSLVSERERGVWRRYRLPPVATGALVASTLLARYVTVLGAGLLQLCVAMAIGGWVPAHPFDLWLTYSLATFTLFGLGLMLAALADTVLAVQALGQCLFLPMLIVGGVAVRLEALPEWVLPVTAFLPGRYAVEAIQASVNGGGLGAVGFHLAALLLIGVATCLAGVKLFRWDREVRRLSIRQKSWTLVALASWVVVGSRRDPARRVGAPRRWRRTDASNCSDERHAVNAAGQPEAAGSATSAPGVTAPPAVGVLQPASAPLSANTATPQAIAAAEPWRALTLFDFAALPIDQVPPDEGDVSPIAADDQAPAGSSAARLTQVEVALPAWAPGHVPDRAQRVRNYLLILGVADYAQSSIERFLPRCGAGSHAEGVSSRGTGADRLLDCPALGRGRRVRAQRSAARRARRGESGSGRGQDADVLLRREAHAPDHRVVGARRRGCERSVHAVSRRV